MSADLLRRAATVLRQHAQDATPGPWVHVDHGPPNGSFMGCGQVITEGAEVYGGDIAGPTGDLYPRGGYSPMEDMAYIALVGPPVALALADLLDAAADARDLDPAEPPRNPRDRAVVFNALYVARAVLREEES